MGIYQRKETGIYYLKIKEGSKYRRISLSTKNRYVAEQLYNSYLLDKVQNKLNVRRNSDIVSISAFQTSCLQAHQEITQNLITEQKRHRVEKSYIEYIDLCESQNLSKEVIQSKNRLKTYLKSVNLP